jgi:Flp pilus assembly pilin Flp
MTHLLILFTKLLLRKVDISFENGQGLAEYTLILLLVAFALIGALTLFGVDLIDVYTRILNALPFAT